MTATVALHRWGHNIYTIMNIYVYSFNIYNIMNIYIYIYIPMPSKLSKNKVLTTSQGDNNIWWKGCRKWSVYIL